MDMDSVVEELAAAGWPGLDVHCWRGAWVATFYRFTEFSFCAIKAIGRGKTHAEAITQAQGEAHAYNSRHREEVHLSSPETGATGTVHGPAE